MVRPSTVFFLLGGAIAGLILSAVATRIVNTFRIRNQQRIVTGVAVASGFVLSLSISPMGAIATELTQMFEVIPGSYPGIVQATATVGTAIVLLYGFGVMWECGLASVVSYVIGFLGGLSLPYTPTFGVLVLGLAWLLMELSPANRW